MESREVIVESTGRETRLQLPVRDLGDGKQLGWIAIALGGLVGLFMIGWMSGPVLFGINMLRKGDLFGVGLILFGATGLVGMYFAAKTISAGWAIVRNKSYTEITISDTEVFNRDRFGWFSFKSRTNIADIDAIRICPALSQTASENPDVARMAFGSSLIPYALGTIFLAADKTQRIAAGYPVPLLRELSSIIRRELETIGVRGIEIVDSMGASQSPAVAGFNASDGKKPALPVDDVVPPRSLPKDSVLEVVEQDGTTVYRVPSRGVARGSHGLFAFSVVWLGFMVIFTSAMLSDLNLNSWDELFGLAVVVLFWAVGIGMMVGAIYLGKQTAMIGVAEGSLFIERKTIFGTSWTEFEPDEIAAVEIGPSGMSVNDVPVKQLHIYARGKDMVGMFTQLSDGELHWLAENLRKELGLGPDDQSRLMKQFDLDQQLVPPATSQVSVHQSEGQTTIRVPALGLASAKGSVVVAAILAVASYPIAIALMIRFGFEIFGIVIPAFATLVGIGMLAYLLLYRTRRFTVRATDSQLTIERRGFLSDRDFEVDRTSLLDVLVADSGVRQNNRADMVLYVKCKDGQGFKMMHGRDDLEIAYVAALILQRMRPQTGNGDKQNVI